MSTMRMYMSELTPLEKEVLDRQLLSSPYFQSQPHNRAPTTLDIFDFDSTLFLSPLLSPNIWHSSFVNAITTENLLGPGWWRDIRSLQVKNNNWSKFWNEDIVKEVQKSMTDPNRMTVLLTGRRYHPFHTLMDDILSSKGLHFDLIGLRPDPESDKPDRPKGLMFNDQLQNVFVTTMEFKTSFIVNILNSVPSLKDIVMWDDRHSHICVFEEYMKQLVANKIVREGRVVCVKGCRPKYNPEWEQMTIQQIINTHNDAILELRQTNKRFTEDIVMIENDGQVISSANTFGLRKVDWFIVLKLSEELTDHLKTLFEPIYHGDLNRLYQKQIAEWEKDNTEQPVYFGNEVLLALNNKENATLLRDMYNLDQGHNHRFKIVARSMATVECGMMLRIQIMDNTASNPSHFFVLPLWYKPSNFNYLLAQNDEWIPIEEKDIAYKQELMMGTVDYHHLLTVDNLEESNIKKNK
ncbi:MAG: hypothetical protein EXX96DRAFT_291454 [Benjaminiella poitrasii]|nr:MAG: hypothetical protein EXX96DRAFT_291454 [Benjaminiella poitrasii]